MRRNSWKTRTVVLLTVLLCLALATGLVLARYAGKWEHGFGLLISPVEQDETDHSLRRYFRSNELLPASEGASYTVNGTSAWFTVANALDSATVSEDVIRYTLTWYVSSDGSAWTEYKTESGTMAAGEYKVDRYELAPVTLNGAVHNYIKVHGKTSSFLQEDLEARYSFVYSDLKCAYAYADGVITVATDTNDMSGEYKFVWPAGITPDNSDPSGLLKTAAAGPAEITVTLEKNTAYESLFFVTDSALKAQLDADPASAVNYVTLVK